MLCFSLQPLNIPRRDDLRRPLQLSMLVSTVSVKCGLLWNTIETQKSSYLLQLGQLCFSGRNGDGSLEVMPPSQPAPTELRTSQIPHCLLSSGVCFLGLALWEASRDCQLGGRLIFSINPCLLTPSCLPTLPLPCCRPARQSGDTSDGRTVLCTFWNETWPLFGTQTVLCALAADSVVQQTRI